MSTKTLRIGATDIETQTFLRKLDKLFDKSFRVKTYLTSKESRKKFPAIHHFSHVKKREKSKQLSKIQKRNKSKPSKKDLTGRIPQTRKLYNPRRKQRIVG